MIPHPNKEEWRAIILRSWESYGTGEPLDPKNVDRIAEEFAKPIEPIPAPSWIHQFDPFGGITPPMFYVNFAYGNETGRTVLHVALEGQRLCLREEPLPSEFIHTPPPPPSTLIPFCNECKTRLATIHQRNAERATPRSATP